jgi:hypothetical protein
MREICRQRERRSPGYAEDTSAVILDPYSVESNHKEMDGMGLLDIETTSK